MELNDVQPQGGGDGRHLFRRLAAEDPDPLHIRRQARQHSRGMIHGTLAWAAGEGRTMHDVDLDVERPTGFIRRIVNFLKERV